MPSPHRLLIPTVAAIALSATFFAACEKKNDSITQAEQADKQAEKKSGVLAPSIEEVKAIAEEGFIYGLPIVMNYAVMNEFVVDKNSGQYKGPFNFIAKVRSARAASDFNRVGRYFMVMGV